MAEIHLHLRVSPPIFRFAFAAGLLSLMAVELASESVTLTTYYPAPSGIYTKMITTGDTYLARDAGLVGIGTTNPPLSKLEVKGGGGILINHTATPSLTFSQSDVTRAKLTYESSNLALYMAGNKRMIIDSTGRAAFSSTADPVIPAQLTNIGLTVEKGIKLGAGLCTTQHYTHGGAGEICPGGQYATTVSGLWAEYFMLDIGPIRVPASLGGDSSASGIPEGDLLCCPCGGTCSP